jgi:hypothetical protein
MKKELVSTLEKVHVFGCEWVVLESFKFNFAPDQDYFLLSFNGNEVFCNNYYGYVVVCTADGHFLYRNL